ncbi:hypothetical protein [Acinetobacter sp. YH12131]|uniref:hypothetical protein n=1 Tax=Acinetobacter sp. YH12131 TaxID=2601115 RepID=UPI0015D17AB7|nr:hypothetical protein [Acinetobacter sp. YH12131]
MCFKKNIYYFLILLFLPFIFLLVFGRFGLEDSDSGFIVGMGWRIMNGEIPYKDFYYVRPVISPFISSFLLYLTPDYGQIVLMRLLNYYQLMLQVFLTVLILKKYYNFEELRLNIYIFSIVCFLITSIGSLYFQWHTTDGVLFGVIGLFLISYFQNKGFLFLIIAGVSLGISALTKQNFFLIPVIGVLFVFFQYNFKKSLQVAFGVLLVFILFYFYLLFNDIVDLFLIQNSGSTTLLDLFKTGFVAYFSGHKFFLIYILLSFLFFYFFIFFQKKDKLKKLFISFIFTLVVINSICFIYLEGSPRIIMFDRLIPIFIVCWFLYLFISKKENIKNHYILIALLGISWASSISWGGMSPLMFFTPVLFSAYYLIQKKMNIFDERVSLYFVILIVFYSSIINSKPYRDNFIWKDYMEASVISKKLAFIQANKTSIDKHMELDKILNKYDKTTVLPSMPGAYYIHNKVNYFSIDWAMDVEAAYDREGLIRDLENCCDYYIIEKKAFGQPIGKEGKFYSSITDYVLHNYRLYDSSYEFFDIYVK